MGPLSAGTVLTATCEGCHRDGDVNQTIGCGWYVDLANADAGNRHGD